MNDTEQLQKLMDLLRENRCGIVMMTYYPSEIPYVVSPIPPIDHHVIMCAVCGNYYDVWLGDEVVLAAQTADQIQQWLVDQTPAWLYDDTEPTEEQRALIRQWMTDAYERHAVT